MSLSLRIGLERQDSSSYVRNFQVQKTTCSGHLWPEAWTRLSKKQKNKEIAVWEKAHARLHAARCNRGIHEVSADANDYLKVIADARLKPENRTVPVVSCVLGSECMLTILVIL